MRRGWRLMALATVLPFAEAGCSDDATAADGSVPRPDAIDEGDASSWARAEPALAILPTLTPCPAGWREVPPALASEDVATCDPWPPTGRGDCAPDEAHLPGTPGCARIGSPCPAAGAFPVAIPSGGAVIYARAGASAGDGSEAQPFGTLAEAVAAAPDGAVVALAVGTFDEAVVIDRPLTLLGACAGGTAIAPSDTARGPAALRITASATVSDVRLGGEAAGLDVEGDGATVSVRDVITSDALGLGWRVHGGAAVTAERVVVRGTRASATETGRGVTVDGAGLVLRAAVVEANLDFGVFAVSGADVTVDGASITDHQPHATNGDHGQALQVAAGSTVAIMASVIEGNRDKAVRADDLGTTLRIADSVIRATRKRESDGMYGFGIAVAFGASVHIERTLVDQNRVIAIAMQHSGSTVTASDLVVRDTRSTGTADGGGYAIDVQSGAGFTGTRVLLAESTTAAIHAHNAGPIAIEDLVVRDTADGEITNIDAEDPVYFGMALWAFGSRSIEIRRARLVRNRFSHVVVAESELLIEDVVMHDGLSESHDGYMGSGIVATQSSFVVRRAVLDNNQAIGVWAIGDLTVGTLADVAIRGTRLADCLTGVCSESAGGFGAASFTGATMSIERFEITDNALVGVTVAEMSSMDLRQGLVARNPIGASVAVPTFDISRLTDQVHYLDNGRNLDSSALPLPGTGGAL